MTTEKMICFDMDGTIANLYGVHNWLRELRNENPAPYIEAEPIWDMKLLKVILESLKGFGWKIAVITWLSKDSSEQYKKEVRKAKREWLEKYDFPFDKFYAVRYGATKADSVRKNCDYGILIDDSDKVRHGWHLGSTVNPAETNLEDFLVNMLKNEHARI